MHNMNIFVQVNAYVPLHILAAPTQVFSTYLHVDGPRPEGHDFPVTPLQCDSQCGSFGLHVKYALSSELLLNF